MITVLHVSADYPDAIEPSKTRAIAELVEGTAGAFRHIVYSLNRIGGASGWTRPGALTIEAEQGFVRSCSYPAPSRGIFLGRTMTEVADQILADLKARGERIDLVQGHKLTIEGLAARHLAGALDIPFMLTIQGNTDQKLLRARPDLVLNWRRCWHEAAECISFAPWASDWISSRLGARTRPAENLPCVLASDDVIAPVVMPPRIRTAFNLDEWRNKNIGVLAAAVAAACDQVQGLSLEIAGSGSPQSEAAIDLIIAKSGAADAMRRVGRVAGNGIQSWMNNAAAFALVSRRETFGMVFAEALLAGCPIIYPRGAAVDGYFPEGGFARGVDAGDHLELRDAIVAGIKGQDQLKQRLGLWQADGGADPFKRASILTKYQSMLERAAARRTAASIRAAH